MREAFEKFRELDDNQAADWMPRGRLASSTVLRTHGMVVMSAIDEIISSLDENSEVIELILEQGRSHARFGDSLSSDAFWVRMASLKQCTQILIYLLCWSILDILGGVLLTHPYS